MAAPPDRVWQLISDVTQIGRYSPETYEAEWVDGATGPAVGARFRGRNRKGRLKWSTKATVTATDPGREFGFETGDTRWRYQMQPSGGGTDLVESFETFKYGRFSK